MRAVTSATTDSDARFESSNLPGKPIQTLQLFGKNRFVGSPVRRQQNLERIALDLRGDWADQGEANLLVVSAWRDNECRTAAGLLVPGLPIELEPHDIAAIRNVRLVTTRLPDRQVARSQSLSWMFLAVTPRSRSFNPYLGVRLGRTMSSPSSTDRSTSDPASTPTCSAKDLEFGDRDCYPIAGLWFASPSSTDIHWYSIVESGLSIGCMSECLSSVDE